MKSRTSFFNVTVFKKNITRFAPVWALYSVFLLMLMVLLAVDNESFYFASNIASSIGLFAIVNFFYAPLCAQLLFGDLYSSRMCNALHAMPLRREDWFCTNTVTGLLLSLVPNTAFAMLCLPLAGDLLIIPFLWLAAVTLQYLFFFGTAVLASYCVGNRFAMALVYLIINGFSIIAYWLVETMYAPLMYGVIIRDDIFFTLSPVVKMVSLMDAYLMVEKQGGYAFARWYFGEGWGYLGICAGLGILAMALALLCYRKRDLETAGDFAAVKPVGPVFLLLYTICGGACCHGFFSVFLGDESELFLFLGLAIGFYTGSMLLKRTVRVFKLKTFLGFGAVALAMILSVIVVRTDLLGIVGWVPKAEQIQSVSITTGGTSNYRNTHLTLTEPEDLEKILQIHQYGLQNRNAGTDGKRDARVLLRYTMKTGAVREREYYVNVDTPCGDMIRYYISHPEMVLGDVYGKPDEFKLQGVEIAKEGDFIVSEEALRSLMDAILADCASGDLAQDWAYIDDYKMDYWISLRFVSKDGVHYYADVHFTETSANLMAWYHIQEETLESAK